MFSLKEFSIQIQKIGLISSPSLSEKEKIHMHIRCSTNCSTLLLQPVVCFVMFHFPTGNCLVHWPRSWKDSYQAVMIGACQRASAKNITTVIPYFGYARADRKAARQLEFLIGRNNTGPNAYSLGDALGFAQQDDDVTGTAKQNVTDDYAKQLAMGAYEGLTIVTHIIKVGGKLIARIYAGKTEACFTASTMVKPILAELHLPLLQLDFTDPAISSSGSVHWTVCLTNISWACSF